MSTPGYEQKCKTCNSPHRAEIERLARVESKSPRWISDYLEKTYGEHINHNAIRNHLALHFDIKSAVWEQYEASKDVMVEATELALEDIKIVDSVIADNFRLHRLLGQWLTRFLEFDPDHLPKEIPKVPMSVAALFEACSSEIRQHMKIKQEMLGEGSGNQSGAAVLTWAELVNAAAEDD